MALNILSDRNRIFYDSGVGKKRNITLLSEFEIAEEKRLALIGFHASIGNDFASAFFGKGKKNCWSLMESKVEYNNAFQSLGNEWNVNLTSLTRRTWKIIFAN